MPPKKKQEGLNEDTIPPKKKPPAPNEDSIIFLLQTVFNFFTKFSDIPSQFKNMTALKKFMKSDDYKDKHSVFFNYHLSMIDHDAGRNIEDAQMLGNKKHSVTFIELCTLINSIMGMEQTVLPIIKLKNLTLNELLDDERLDDFYILQVTWNRETEQSLKNLRASADAMCLRKYQDHVIVCDDEVFLTDEYDDEFSGLMFFMGGINMGQASHIKSHFEPALPINAYHLFNMGDMGEDGEADNCCCHKIEKNETYPSLVKSIEAVYKLSFSENNGVVGQPVSPYNISESVQSSSAMGSSATARRAELSSKIKKRHPDDKDGFEDMTLFWNDVESTKSITNLTDEAADKTAVDDADADVAAVAIKAHNKAKIVQEMDIVEFDAHISATLGEHGAATNITMAAEDETMAINAATAPVLADGVVTKEVDVVAATKAKLANPSMTVEEFEAHYKAEMADFKVFLASHQQIHQAASSLTILGDAVVTKTSATATTAVAAETTTKATKDAEDEAIAAKLLECKPAEATALANANVTTSPSILAKTASAKCL